MKYTATDMMYLREIATAMREVATPDAIHSIILVAQDRDPDGKWRATECPELHLELFDLLRRMALDVEWDEYVLGTRAEFDELIRDGISGNDKVPENAA